MTLLEDVSGVVGQMTVVGSILAMSATIVIYFVVRSIYLLYFHPYAKFPGPKIAAVTDLWYTKQWLSGRYPWIIESTLKKYGDVVRIAPNEVVFFTAEAMQDILNTGHVKSKPLFPKTNFYTVRGKYAGIAAEQDPEKHKFIRKTLAPAVAPKALKELDPVLHEVFDSAIEKMLLRGNTAEGLDMSVWFDWVACDLSGRLAYGHNFHNVDNESLSPFLEVFNKLSYFGTLDQIAKRFQAVRPLILFALPLSVIKMLPWFLSEQNKIVQNRVDSRNDLKQRDYFSAFIADDKPIPDNEWLVAQATHFIIGGLDPDTNLFTTAVLFLAQNPRAMKKVQEEVRTTFATYEDINDDQLKKMPWLGGVIEESMRLHTPGAFGLPRISPGATVDGHYIPKGCVVQTSGFAATHSERYWAKPRSFHPERWLSETHPDYDSQFANDNHDSFKPFSMGPRGCMGKEMGYRQVRALLGKMIWKMEWEHVNLDLEWERDLRLYATWNRPQVRIRYTLSDIARAAQNEKVGGLNDQAVLIPGI